MVFISIVEGDGFGFTTTVQVDQDFVISEYPRYEIKWCFFLEYNATDNMEQSQSNIYKHRQISFRTRKTEQRKLPLLPSRELVRKTRWREGGFQCRERCCWPSSSSKKTLVWIILAIVLTHKITIKKYMFV